MMLKLKPFTTITLCGGLLIGVMLPLGSAMAHEEFSGDGKFKAIKVVNQWLNSLGGIEQIAGLKNQKISSTIQRWEPEQTFRPGAPALHVATIERSVTQQFAEHQSIAELKLSSLYPTISEFEFREIINQDQGYIDGIDGIFSGPRAAMLSTRLATRQKHYFMTSTLALARYTLEHMDSIRYAGKGKIEDRKHHVISFDIWNQRIDLFIDVKTFQLRKVQTLEADSVYGDASWEVAFQDWASVAGIILPYNVEHFFNGIKIAQEQRHNIVLDVTIDNAMFVVPPDLRRPLDEEDYAWGIRSSQFFARTLAFGIPFDINQGRPELVDIQEIADKVFHVRGPTHNSLIIEMADYLVLVDPVLYEHRSQAIIDKVKQLWPAKKITYVIASHFHADHIGGIRAYGALGATLIVGPESKDHYAAIFKAQHTVTVDAYQQRPVDVKIIEIDEDFVLSDGSRRVRLLNIDNRHAMGLLVPYVEDVKMIFTSDLYNPGIFASPIPALFSYWTMDLADALQDIDLPIDAIAGAHGGVSSFQQFLDDVELLR
ncbi:MAG: MBL fold metallo-hydrolase [Thiohalomonadales bacterium]